MTTLPMPKTRTSRLLSPEKAFLTQPGPALKLSIYAPFDRSWQGPKERRILFRDLFREAGNAMRARGALDGGIDAVLAPLEDLASSMDEPHLPGEGAALFSDGESGLWIPLARRPKTICQIDTCFRLDGILPQFYGRDRFYLLALSEHAARIWDCDAIEMREISLEGLETDIRNSPAFEGTEFQSVIHSISSGHPDRAASSYAGIGTGDARDLKAECEAFYRRLDKGIRARIPDPSLPMALSGAGFLAVIYRRASAYARLMESDLPGNPGGFGAGPEGLHSAANAMLVEAERKERNAALGDFAANLAGPRSSAGYSDVVPGACRKALTHLFLTEGAIQWGDYEPDSGRTTLYPGYRDGAVDLANLACVHAIRSGAKVYAVPEGEMPRGAAIAGLMRT